MKPKITLALLLCTMTLICHAQSFLSKYPKLTKKNLSEFFVDWKAYSDSITVIEDSVLAEVVKHEYAVFWLQSDIKPNGITPKYRVFPQNIEVERCYFDVDTTQAKFDFDLAVTLAINDQSVIDSFNITPVLPHRGLYLTDSIDRVLSKFIGGLWDGNTLTKIKDTNVFKLEKYVPVAYGHWGGYWWFTSFPLITKICYTNNLIAVMRRTSWCRGDTILYIKQNDKFIRRQQPIRTWIE